MQQATNPKNPRVFFDLEIGGKPAGRVTFELFKNIVPQTAENFRQLCTGENARTTSNGKKLHFKGTIFHRVIPGFMMQGGDFTKFNGTGGESIYGHKFADENFKLRHSEKGLLSMANAGRNTNGSQFFVTFVPTSYLDGKHVVFGRVEKGFDLCQRVEKLRTNKEDMPMERVVVANCGEIKPEVPKEEIKKEELVKKVEQVVQQTTQQQPKSVQVEKTKPSGEGEKKTEAHEARGRSRSADSSGSSRSASSSEERRRKRREKKKLKKQQKKDRQKEHRRSRSR